MSRHATRGEERGERPQKQRQSSAKTDSDRNVRTSCVLQLVTLKSSSRDASKLEFHRVLMKRRTWG